MNYRIAIDPQLGLSAVEFTDAWNASQYNEDALAVVKSDSRESFLSPEITVVLIAAAVSIPASVISNLVTEVLKKKFLEKKPPKVSVTTTTTPEGQPVLIIKPSEE